MPKPETLKPPIVTETETEVMDSRDRIDHMFHVIRVVLEEQKGVAKRRESKHRKTQEQKENILPPGRFLRGFKGPGGLPAWTSERVWGFWGSGFRAMVGA